jgi:hypothetical protein
LSKEAPPLYNRIGNDIEQIVFFGPSAERLAHSLSNLLDSKDPEMRHLAARAVLLVRKTNFGAVNKIAGETGPEVKLVSLKGGIYAGRGRSGKGVEPACAGRAPKARSRRSLRSPPSSST